MAVIPAQVQSVNTSYDIPQDNPFLTMLQAGAQGFFNKQNEPKRQFASAFPTLAQMKMLETANQGDEGALPFGGAYWKPKSPGLDYTDYNQALTFEEKKRDLDPMYQATKWAMSEYNNNVQKLQTNNVLLTALGQKPMPEPDPDTTISSLRNVWLKQYGYGQQPQQTQSQVQTSFKTRSQAVAALKKNKKPVNEQTIKILLDNPTAW